jgi:predicted ATP-binding protein involved in virulence
MYLKVVNLPYVFEVHRSISPIFPVENHSFYLRDTRNNALLGMQDVGFGVGQLIPVIAELASVDGGILLLEQPELHLHPKMQAELGQLLANAVQQ